jgi:uncharacterized protein (TIGR00297 family)
MPTQYFILPVILVAILTAVYKLRKLTLAGTIIAGLIAISLYYGFVLPGIAMLAAFFILATIATSFKKHQKKVFEKGAEPERRDAYQVLANGGIAGILGILNTFIPWLIYPHPLIVLMAASLASATADTLSSELGTIYGKRFYNITTLKPGIKGKDGVVSMEGSLFGVAGSTVIALLFACYFGWTAHAAVILIAGTAGNLFDSVLGATIERKGYVSNNVVNLSNCTFAAFTAWLLMLI